MVREPQGRDPLIDIGVGPAWMRVAAADGSAALRLYRPQPTVAFSSRDCLSPGIGAAVRAARSAGFVPVRRGPGGRATAYHPGCMGIDLVSAAPRGAIGIRDRFVDISASIGAALRAVGVPAVVGEVPGEYCPGEFSLHDGNGHKLVGTAQRVIPGGWLVSSMVVVTAADQVRDVLVEVYRHLGLELDPSTVGAASDAVLSGRRQVSVDAVEDALLAAFGEVYDLVAGVVPDSVSTTATASVDRARPPEPG